MDFLLKIPVWIGLLIVIATITIAGLITVILVKKFIEPKLTKQHEKVGRILFRITASLIAFLISLSYANERINQSKIIDSMENEAALIVNIAMHLKIYESEESKLIRNKLIEYVELTINDDWKNVIENPFYSSASKTLLELNNLIYKLPVNDKNQELLKSNLTSEINEVNKFMQTRIYSQQELMPYLIYILTIGLLFIWVFYTVYELDLLSLTFLSLYNILIAIIIYFIFMLSNPLVGPLRLEPNSFIIIKNKGVDNTFN